MQPELLLAPVKRGLESGILCAGKRQRWPDHKDPHDLRRQRCPPKLCVIARSASDISNARALLDQVLIPRKPGCRRKRYRWLLADKGYDSERLCRYCDLYRMPLVVPLQTLKRKPKPKPKPGLLRLFDHKKLAALHHQADVRLAEGKSRDRSSLRKAGKRLRCDGQARLHATLFYSGIPRTELVARHLKE